MSTFLVSQDILNHGRAPEINQIMLITPKIIAMSEEGRLQGPRHKTFFSNVGRKPMLFLILELINQNYNVCNAESAGMICMTVYQH